MRLVICTAHLHDNFTLLNISNTLKILPSSIELLLFKINEKIPNTYSFSELKYIKINKLFREFLRTKISFKNSEDSNKDFMLGLFANNFIESYVPKDNYEINDLKKLSYFSFFSRSTNEIFRINGLFIRDAYFNRSYRLNVYTVINSLFEIINKDSKNYLNEEFCYLVSIFYEPNKNYKTNIKLFNLIKFINKDNKNNNNSLKYLAYLRFYYDFEEKNHVLNEYINKKKNSTVYINKKKEIRYKKILNIFKLLLENFKPNENLIVDGWIIFFISYYTKLLNKYRDNSKEIELEIDKKYIVEILIILQNKFPEISKNLKLIINEEVSKNGYNSYQPIHEFCIKKINSLFLIWEKLKSSNNSDRYHPIDMEILKKELEHFRIRILNISLELFVLNISKNHNKISFIENENRFLEVLEKSKEIGYLTGAAISENIFSHFYYFKNKYQYDKNKVKNNYRSALDHIDKSIKYNEDTYDYSGVKLTLKIKVDILKDYYRIEKSNHIIELLERTEAELRLIEIENSNDE
jgi:hypothetical protein